MGLSLVAGKSKYRTKKLDDQFCAYEDCCSQPLNGRLHCYEHELLAEADLPEESIPEKGDIAYVYFIAVEGEDVVKIGRTVGNATSRLQALQTGHYKKLVLLASIEMPFKVERWIHKVLAAHHIRGEWFQRTEEVNRIIDAAKTGKWENFFQAFA